MRNKKFWKTAGVMGAAGVMAVCGAAASSAATMAVENQDGTVAYYEYELEEGDANEWVQNEAVGNEEGDWPDSYLLRVKERKGNVVQEAAREETAANAGDGGNIAGEAAAEETAEEEAAEEKANGETANSAEEGKIVYEMDAEELSGDDQSLYFADEQRREEYEKFGIGQIDGTWTWEGTPIRFLLDDDGSLYSSGSEEALKGKLYVYVSRKEDGSIQSAEVVNGREVMEKMAASDVR